jgi:hypothetical protein
MRLFTLRDWPCGSLRGVAGYMCLCCRLPSRAAPLGPGDGRWAPSPRLCCAPQRFFHGWSIIDCLGACTSVSHSPQHSLVLVPLPIAAFGLGYRCERGCRLLAPRPRCAPYKGSARPLQQHSLQSAVTSWPPPRSRFVWFQCYTISPYTLHYRTTCDPPHGAGGWVFL